MERLTKKSGSDCTYKNKYNQAYHKLGILEDLSEKIGCPIEVVFKAFRDGLYIGAFFEEGMIISLERIENNYYIYTTFGNVNLKDYKKTWWLKADKSE